MKQWTCPRCGPTLAQPASCSRINPFDYECLDWKDAEYGQHEHMYCARCRTWYSDRQAGEDEIEMARRLRRPA